MQVFIIAVVVCICGAMAKVAIVGQTPNNGPVLLTLAELAGSVVTGIGGGRILSSEVEKKALVKVKDQLTDALRQR